VGRLQGASESLRGSLIKVDAQRQFWKQFFESSANVSLSGYEEQPSTHDLVNETVTDESNATTHTTLDTSESYDTPSAQHISTDSIQDIDLSNLTISPSHSTPRPTTKQTQVMEIEHSTATFADYPSPYEALRQQLNNSNEATNLSHIQAPETPAKSSAVLNDSRDIAMTPQSSPFLPPTPSSIPRPSTARKKTDPILHRVLDRNYRVQATPMANNRYAYLPTAKVAYDDTKTIPAKMARNNLLDSRLSSSPEIAPPELHAEIFSSPMRKPRTPGVSVLTPGKGKMQSKTPGIWDSDDEFDEDDFGQSPPKTMQFHVPQSRLLKTPGT
jgi:DASH complex subunit ASK1